MFEQNRVIVRLQQRVLREKTIVLCFLAGSFGRGVQDIYSDIDVVLAFANQWDLEESYTDRAEFAQSVMPYVPAKSFEAKHILPYFHIALYSNGAKVDFLYKTISSLESSQLETKVRILKDTVGWTERLESAAVNAPAPVTQPAINSNMLSTLDDRFWVMYFDIYRLLLRGETGKSFPIYLQMLYFTLPEILSYLPAGPERASLCKAYFDLDSDKTLAHFKELLPAYIQARKALIKRFDLSFRPNTSFERQIQEIVQKS